MANRDVVLFAVDYSGSTSRSRDYWSRVDPILKEYVEKYNECEIEYVLWDTTVSLISQSKLVLSSADISACYSVNVFHITTWSVTLEI